jgi:acyl carrier protein
MKEITESSIRRFLLHKYREAIRALGFTIDDVGDDFDLMLNGVIDSLGILELMSAIEEEFQIELDLAALDAKEITVLGPLSRYVAEGTYSRVECKPNSVATGD